MILWLPILGYILLFVWVNHFIKVRIPDEKQRKAYRKQPVYTHLIGNLRKPLIFFAFLLFCFLCMETAQLEIVKKINYFLQIPLFLLASASVYFDFKFIKQALMELEENKKRSNA